MKRPWHQREPGLADQIRADLRARFPSLHLFVAPDGAAAVRGTFLVRSPEGDVLDRYRIAIELHCDYPKSLPVVREVEGRIPWREDRHVNGDGTACVLLPDDRWRCFPEGAPVLRFLDGPVHDFFLGQSLAELGKPWPFGQWSHGKDGILEYYQWLLATRNSAVVVSFLQTLAKRSFKGHLPCPCGSGQKIRRCCRAKVVDLRAKIPAATARKTLKALGARSQIQPRHGRK